MNTGWRKAEEGEMTTKKEKRVIEVLAGKSRVAKITLGASSSITLDVLQKCI